MASKVDPEKTNGADSEEIRTCEIEEVALVVPETDDPSLPVMTFRTWFLGITSCTILIFLNTFFSYRTQPLTISAILMQIAVLPVGKFMAKTLPNKEFNLMGFKFNLNPGPFNMKEHVVITIFANCGVSTGGGDAYSTGAITVMKAYYHQSLSFICGLFLVLTSQVHAPFKVFINFFTLFCTNLFWLYFLLSFKYYKIRGFGYLRFGADTYGYE